MSDPVLNQLHADLSRDLESVARRFKGHPKLTLIIRHADKPDHSQDVVLTNDNYDAAIETLQWSKAGEVTESPSEQGEG